jgi:hypothetical protein
MAGRTHRLSNFYSERGPSPDTSKLLKMNLLLSSQRSEDSVAAGCGGGKRARLRLVRRSRIESSEGADQGRQRRRRGRRRTPLLPRLPVGESTFQLVIQAPGRVGPGEEPRVVAVQTARADHPFIAAAIRQDPDALDAELSFRRPFRYPPCTRLLLALWADPDASSPLPASPVASTVRLLGPAHAPLGRLKGLSRVQLLVRSESRETRPRPAPSCPASRSRPVSTSTLRTCYSESATVGTERANSQLLSESLDRLFMLAL